jgi:hypothetical protein
MARRNGEVSAWAVELLELRAGEHVPPAGRLDRSAYGLPAERTGELEAALSAAGLQPTARGTGDCEGEATLALLVTRGDRG